MQDRNIKENLYHVINRHEQKVYSFYNMTEALKHYDNIWGAYEKELHVELPYAVPGQSRINSLLKYVPETHSNEVYSSPSRAELDNPWFALAYSRALLHCNADNSVAWSIRDESEKKLGITERVVDHSTDLIVGYWRVHVIPTGGRYGKHNELVNTGKPGVEFYDIRHTDNELAPLGLGIKRCYIDEILGSFASDKAVFPNGFNLHPKIPNQMLSFDEMNKVIKYLKDYSPVKEKQTLSEQIAQAGEHALSNKDSVSRSIEPERI